MPDMNTLHAKVDQAALAVQLNDQRLMQDAQLLKTHWRQHAKSLAVVGIGGVALGWLVGRKMSTGKAHDGVTADRSGPPQPPSPFVEIVKRLLLALAPLALRPALGPQGVNTLFAVGGTLLSLFKRPAPQTHVH